MYDQTLLAPDAPPTVAKAFDEVEQLRKAISKNTATKAATRSRLKENEKAAEAFHARLRDDRRVTSDEKRELLELMYRIGNLELGNMQLEQAQVVHASVVRGKDLEIKRLKLQLRTQKIRRVEMFSAGRFWRRLVSAAQARRADR